MRSIGLASSSVLTLSVATLMALFACAGCSSDGEGPEETEDTGELRDGESTVALHLTIAESKIVFSSRTEAFSIGDGPSRSLPCRDREFHLTSKNSLYKDGWSVDQAARFSEDEQGADFREYPFASCRDAKTEVLGWFGKERDIEFSVSEQLLDDDYKPTQLPLLLRRKELGGTKADYFKCDSAFEKRLISENDKAKRFDISVKCKSTREPTKAVRGPIDFISNPGPYAAVGSYRGWMLPPVTSNAASIEKVRAGLLDKVADGKYSGAMSTLSKLCNLDVKKTSDGLAIDHTIVSSRRTRHLELKADDLLGYVEGDVYVDPIRISEKTGKFAAAEFRDEKGGSFIVRFEQNDNADAKIVRINGSEAYCRRLQRQ
jgi:hypothetical protein